MAGTSGFNAQCEGGVGWRSIQCRKVAWMRRRPETFPGTLRFLPLHKTSLTVKWPQKTKLTNKSKRVINYPPKRNMNTRSAVLLWKEPLSSI